MLYFKVLKQNPSDGSDLWAYEKHDPSAKSAEDWVRDFQIADGKTEVTEEEYLREVPEGTEGRSTEDVVDGDASVSSPEEAPQSPTEGEGAQEGQNEPQETV